MKIPKVIHYCWFGKNPLSNKILKCIASWKKYCPDYQIIEWNESNFDFSSNQYAAQAYASGKYAFVSDYARLKIIYEHGGIYLDTDVELLRPIDPLIDGDGFMAFQNDGMVATGLGFAAPKHHPVIYALMQDYQNISFINSDGSYDTTPCPNRNTSVLYQLGLKKYDGQIQMLQGLTIYPEEYFSPKDFSTGILKKSPNTYGIHHYHASWVSEQQRAIFAHDRKKAYLKAKLPPRIYSFLERLWQLFHGKF